MSKTSIFAALFTLISLTSLSAQELFIYSPAAANISKKRLEIRNNVMGYNSFQYFHNSFDVNYGITGKLTIYNKMFYTFDDNYKLIGDFEPMLRYRFYDKDAMNSHFRMAVQSGVRIPIESRSVTGDRVVYELHPGHVVDFYNSPTDITVPGIDFHTTDNFTWKSDVIATYLKHRLAISAHAGYNINFAKTDFRFGNYHDWGLAFGYLIFPREYTSYDQVNINLYFENKGYFFERNKFKGETVLNSGGFRWDGFVGVQSIYFSTLIVEAGYGFPIHSNEFTETRVEKRKPSMLFSVRYLFFL